MDGQRRAVHLKLVTSPPGSEKDPSAPVRNVVEKLPHLQAVLPPPPEAVLAAKQERADEQLTLFPIFSPSLLGILNMEHITGRRFAELLRDVRPRWLFDVRPLPRFDIDQLNRRRAFQLFQQCGIDYCDMAGLLGIASLKDASLSSGRIASEVTKRITGAGAKSSAGPIVVLVDDDEVARHSLSILPEQLHPRPKGGWYAQFLR